MPELMLLAFVLVTVAATFWVARDARARKLDPLPWALLTLILLPVGVVLYLLRVLMQRQATRHETAP